MRFRVLTAFFLLLSVPAYAQQAGEPCEKFGQTIVADDKKSVLACLRATLGDPASPLVWMVNTVAPKAWQPSSDTGSEPFYTIGPQHKAGE
jgi:hypothetical protein